MITHADPPILQWWRGYGLVIQSELPIAGAVAVSPSTSAADITIRIGDAQLTEPTDVSGPYSLRGNSLLFAAAGIANFLASYGTTLTIQPVQGADPQQISDLMIATALPMLLWMRGGLVLHAGGVIMPGERSAIALSGPSGVGKSTLLDQLVNQGARLISDDSLWLNCDKLIARISGLPSGYFLRENTGNGRLFIEKACPTEECSAELSAIIMLHRGEKTTAPSRLDGVSALQSLLQNRHRPRVPNILCADGRVFTQCALHSRTIPIYAMTLKEGDVMGSGAQLLDFISKSRF